MSIDPGVRRRQPTGTPAGGQFATEARTEPDLALSVGRTVPHDPPAPIMMTFDLYATEQDDEPFDRVNVDATEILRQMPAAERREALEKSYVSGLFFDQAVRHGLIDHDGASSLDAVTVGGHELTDPDAALRDSNVAAALDWLDGAPQAEIQRPSEATVQKFADRATGALTWAGADLGRAALVDMAEAPGLGQGTWHRGALGGLYSTRPFDADLTDMPLEPWPGDDPAPSTDLSYGDSGALEMTFVHQSRKFTAVYDDLHGTILYDCDTGHIIATDGRPEDDEDFYDLPTGASRWAMSVYSRASHVESAVRYSALASARAAILDAATGAVR